MEDHSASVRKAVADVLAASTAHGISRAAATKSIPLKIMWSLLFIVFLTLFFISAMNLIGRLVNITVVTNHEADKVLFEFPDLYFCPSLSYSGSIPYSLKESEAKLVNDEVDRLNKLYDKLYCATYSCVGDSFGRATYIQLSMPVQLMRKFLMQSERQAFLLPPYVYSLAFITNNDVTRSIFVHPTNELCFKVQVGAQVSSNLAYKRSALFAWPFVDPYYPAFNYTGAPIKPIVNPRDNVSVPFQDWLSINGYHNINSLGYNLIIVPKGHYPSPIHSTVLKLSAGRSHRISIDMLKHVFSPDLYGELCDPNASNVIFQDHLTGEPVNFQSSLASCFYDEMASRLHKRFNCLYTRHPRPWHLRHVPRVENMTEVFLSNASGVSRYQMRLFIDAETQNVIETCKHRQPCTHPEFSATITSQKWPQFGTQLASLIVEDHSHSTHAYHEETTGSQGSPMPALEQLVRLSRMYLSGNYSDRTEALFRRFVSDSMLEVDISVASPLCPLKVTAYSYSWVAFLADIGGTLGLYIGCSLMTVCELLELLYNLVAGSIVARRAAAARRSRGDPAGAELEATAGPLDAVEGGCEADGNGGDANGEQVGRCG